MKNCTLVLILWLCVLNINAYANPYTFDNNASISIEHKLAEPGDTVLIAVTATGFQDISAFDCRIAFNDHVLDTLSIQNTVVNIHPDLLTAVYNVINGNMVSLAWFSLSPLSIPDNEKLFDLQLIFCDELYTCALNGTSSPLQFIEHHTAFVIGDEEIPLEYNHGSVSAYVPLKALSLNQTGQGLVMVNESVYEEPTAVDQNTVVTLQAIPQTHWAFDTWSGDISGTENPVNLVMNDHKEVNVLFVEDTIPYDYTLSLAIVGHGTVETDGEPYAPLQVFDEATTVSLEAVSDVGWSFAEWAGDANGTDNPRELLVDGNKSAIAIFYDLKSFTIAFEITDSNCIPVDNATVSLDDVENPPGDYVFEDIEPGNYSYAVTADGYVPKTGSVEVTDADVMVSMSLEEDPSTAILFPDNIECYNDTDFFRLYPNPMKDNFSLVFDDFLNVSVFTVEVYTIHGEKILHEKISADQTPTFSLESHPPGMYFIKAMNESHAGVQYLIKID